VPSQCYSAAAVANFAKQETLKHGAHQSPTSLAEGIIRRYFYPLTHSPAVLANLWDVTDRDIDRLSYGVFSRWGLCEGERPKSRGSDDGQFEPERGMGLDFGGGSIGERKRQLQASIRGKKYVATRKGVSLSEALAMAREDCTLKYLNGAAPVIYGVPVFLEERK
jgi:separase